MHNLTYPRVQTDFNSIFKDGPFVHTNFNSISKDIDDFKFN